MSTDREQAEFTKTAAELVKQNDLARLAADGVIPAQREPENES